MAYNTTEAVAKFLSGFQMKITNRERDTVAPDYYVKYSLTLSKGGKDFSTTFVSDPRAFGEPTVTQVFSALADDALTLRKYSTDEFVDKLYAQGVKPSAALRAYDSCKETNLWMQDELYLSGWEIEEISKTLTKYEDEVNTLVEKAASERAARYAYDHPKLPKGFVTIEQLQGDLDLGDLRDEVEDFDFDGDITEAFGETAEYKVDDNYHALLTWLPDHTEWLEEAEFNGLLEGCEGDIYKMVRMAQYVYFKPPIWSWRTVGATYLWNVSPAPSCSPSTTSSCKAISPMRPSAPSRSPRLPLRAWRSSPPPWKTHVMTPIPVSTR